ncbi:MAG TPA: hypothetical protein PKE07_12485 [Lacibacter sp.]|nr:hypothetical protein [Lacibacter sp.]HMO89969.1 hypothetical protein [Lacibacter sp.]
MDLIVVILLVLLLYLFQRQRWIRRVSDISRFSRTPEPVGYIDILAGLHLGLFLVYYSYALVERSDSVSYWFYTSESDNWLMWWGTDTRFIQFITWPLSSFLGLSYESCMLIFGYIGMQGVMLFYFAAKENLPFLRPIYRSFSIVELVFLLPNIHFWSNSIGKGPVMLLGIGLIIYGLSRFQKRWILIVLGALLVYMIRGHVLFIIIVGTGMGLMFTLKGIKWYYKGLMVGAALAVGLFILDDLGKYTGRTDVNIFESQKLRTRAIENTRATTGVDIGNYNQAQKLFTFWYRPLFVDAPGFLGIVVSFENLIYILMTLQIIRYCVPNWRNWNGWFRIGLFIFLLGSIALAQMAANLGLAMRQKAQIMPLFFIIYCKAMSYKGVKRRV